MARFTYTAEKQGGEIYRGIADVPDKFELYKTIRREGAHVVSVSEVGGANVWSFSYWNLKMASVPEHSKVILARNLGSMLSAGLSLARALDVSERQANNAKLSQVLSEVVSDVRHGSTLHEALEKFPKVFSRLFTAMVHAGEESGNLSSALTVVGEQMERAYALKKSIQGALVYPCVIVVAIFGVGGLLMTNVVPQLASTFKELKTALPISTQIMIGMSDFLVNNTTLALAIIVGTVVGVVAILRTKIGARAADFAVLHLPVVGEMVRETNAARAGRTLSSLISSGVDMLSAIGITKDVVQNSYFQDVLVRAAAGIEKGEPLSKAFATSGDLYPPLVGEMISVGEETGQLAIMLGRVADFYEAEVMRKSKDMSTIIEPFLMIAIGGAVGFFAMAMIAPIYQLSNAL